MCKLNILTLWFASVTSRKLNATLREQRQSSHYIIHYTLYKMPG